MEIKIYSLIELKLIVEHNCELHKLKNMVHSKSDDSGDYVEITGYDGKYRKRNWLSVGQFFSVLHQIIFIIIPLIGLFDSNEAMRRWWSIAFFGYLIPGGLFTIIWQGYAMYNYNSVQASRMSEHHNSYIWMGFTSSWATFIINMALIFTWLVRYGPPASALGTPVVDPSFPIEPAFTRYNNLLLIVALLSLFSLHFLRGALAAHNRPEKKMTKLTE